MQFLCYISIYLPTSSHVVVDFPYALLLSFLYILCPWKTFTQYLFRICPPCWKTEFSCLSHKASVCQVQISLHDPWNWFSHLQHLWCIWTCANTLEEDVFLSTSVPAGVSISLLSVQAELREKLQWTSCMKVASFLIICALLSDSEKTTSMVLDCRAAFSLVLCILLCIHPCSTFRKINGRDADVISF